MLRGKQESSLNPYCLYVELLETTPIYVLQHHRERLCIFARETLGLSLKKLWAKTCIMCRQDISFFEATSQNISLPPN